MQSITNDQRQSPFEFLFWGGIKEKTLKQPAKDEC